MNLSNKNTQKKEPLVLLSSLRIPTKHLDEETEVKKGPASMIEDDGTT